MSHKPLPSFYYDTVTHCPGTVTLYPDFDAVMFQPQTGGRPDQFSPDIAGKRLRLVDMRVNEATNGFVWFADPIDWYAKLNALRDPTPSVAKGEASVDPEPAPTFRPTFSGLVEFADAGFLQEVNRLVLHPSGRALSFTSDKETGAIQDVTIWITDDPAGIAFLPDADGMANFIAKAERVAKEIADRSVKRLKDPDLKGNLIEPVPGAVPVYEHIVSRFSGDFDALESVISNLGLYDSYSEILPTMQDKAEPEICAAIETFHRGLNGMVQRAESFLLSDDHLDATQRQTGAHDAAMRILGMGGKDPDPRATMRGEIARLTAAIATHGIGNGAMDLEAARREALDTVTGELAGEMKERGDGAYVVAGRVVAELERLGFLFQPNAEIARLSGEVERLKAETSNLAGQARAANTTLGQVRSTLDGFLAFDSVEISPEMADRDLAELLAQALKRASAPDLSDEG